MPHKKRRYVVHLFVVSRLTTASIETTSARLAALKARDWYQRTRKDIDAGELALVDEISHYLVDVEEDRKGDREPPESESFEAEEHPLPSRLRQLVLWHQGSREEAELSGLVQDARELLAHSV